MLPELLEDLTGLLYSAGPAACLYQWFFSMNASFELRVCLTKEKTSVPDLLETTEALLQIVISNPQVTACETEIRSPYHVMWSCLAVIPHSSLTVHTSSMETL